MQTVLHLHVDDLNEAFRAFKRKTGKDFVHIPTRSYETYSNEVGWDS